MSAAEFIEQFKALPDAERRAVAEFVLAWSSNDSGVEPAPHSRDERFRAAADKVLREHAELLRRLAQ
ncbi:MAG: hypothetical protein M3463_11620 [Verrucomicrobiota bacterium]|nr:hypothetical protein [Verrucomicrobiota bacterium]